MKKANTGAGSTAQNFIPIIIISLLFFVFGFVTWINSILIPYLKIACQLNNLESYLVAFAFYIAYLVMAIPSAWLLKKTGFKNGMSAGLLIMAIGALIFIPAALTRAYPLFLSGLFVQGTGLAVLQSASNPYITILGPIESAAKRISMMGIFNKLAGAIAPIILGAVTLKDADLLIVRLAAMSDAEKQLELDQLAHRVLLPYIIIMIVLVVLAVFIRLSSLPEVEAPQSADENTAGTKPSLWQFPHLVVGIITLFVYVGAEVLAGDSIVNYGASLGISLATSKFFTACTMSGMVAGYIIGIICIPRYIKQEKALTVSAILGVIFSVAAVLTHGYASVFCIALLGLANSLVWPAIWPLAIKGLGSYTRTGSSLLIMGIAGGALIPLLYGRIADMFSLQHAYVILIPCYLMIFYFSVWGHKLVPQRVTRSN
ncbi:glucose/galactose transporter [Mucilaginibacter yixingensis]|uniref:Glucose/galactose transporter n=1 Tax=Mucilaginibacter yixingensis TaxID=1295612 RepID=A0A2T5J624_9SPHI|nr:sugar MFS transporter [Mucilaginibacter yixingensis]PTQ93988.1 glucose/galactose transporter [Mucilaginibacter yixingensis]